MSAVSGSGQVPSQAMSVDDDMQAGQLKEAAADAATAIEQIETAQADSTQEDATDNTLAGTKVPTKPLQAKRAESEIKVSESVLVRADDEDEQFEGFNKDPKNAKYNLPQKQCTDLAKELKPGDDPAKILSLVFKHLLPATGSEENNKKNCDPVTVYKSFDYLTAVVTAKIAKAETQIEKTALQELKDNIEIAKRTYYNDNKKILDSTTDDFMEIASRSVDMREKEALAQLAETLTPKLKGLNSEAITKEVQNLVPDTKVTTVVKEFDALLAHLENELDVEELTSTDKKELQAIQQTVNKAKVDFGKLHATELKLAADMSVELKDVLMKMRDIVFSTPQTAPEKAKKHSNDYKGLIKEANELFHFIGSLVKDAKMENTQLGRIIDECKTLQAAKQVPLQAEKNIPPHERSLAKMGVIESAAAA